MHPDTPLDVFGALQAAAEIHPTRAAFVHREQRITYAELVDAVDHVARGMAARGVVPGRVVVCTLASSIDFVLTVVGALRVGAIATAINPRLGPSERNDILRRVDPALVVSSSVAVAALLAAGSIDDAPAVPRDVDLDAPAAIVWTSGTTGRPNGAVYAQRQFAAITAAMGGLTQPDDVRINAIPFAHVGFMTRLHDEFANATTTVIASEPWRAADYLRAVAAERVTVATGVPTQWTLLLDHPDMRTTDLTSLRMAGIGAASIDPALVRRMMDVLGVPVMNRYTSTEAGIGTGTRLGDDPETVTTTVGRPGPGVELVIDAPDERGIGEILFRSPAMMRGYWHDDAQTAATIDTAGFLHTGDLGRIGNDGNLRIVGRRKEMYIRGGYNVYPVEIENVLTTMTGIRAAAVVGVPDPVLGEVGVAFLALDDARNNHVPDLDSVRAWCQARLADYKAPDRLHIIDALPLTPMGKIDKRSLVDRARARRSNP